MGILVPNESFQLPLIRVFGTFEVVRQVCLPVLTTDSGTITYQEKAGGGAVSTWTKSQLAGRETRCCIPPKNCQPSKSQQLAAKFF